MAGITISVEDLGLAMNDATTKDWRDFFSAITSDKSRARLIEHVAEDLAEFSLSRWDYALDETDRESLKVVRDRLDEYIKAIEREREQPK